MAFNWQEIKAQARRNEAARIQEKRWTKRILTYIFLTLGLIMLIGGVSGYFWVKHTLSPVDSAHTQTIDVTIPIGSTRRDVATILKEANIIHHERIFDYYLKSKNVALQAGHYELSPSMSAEEIVAKLESGGIPIAVDVDTKITVIEGMTMEQIAKAVAEKTSISQDEFMKVVTSDTFFQQLKKKFPSLLMELDTLEGLKYKLEGYLYPATYDYVSGETAEDLITQMVGKTNLEYQKLKESGALGNTWMNFHQVLTLASIVEKEGITDEDRKLIAGVFLNRLEVGMPLQSDITILYALGVHKELVTFDDLEVESPYNLYKHTGMGPGPFNSPSFNAVSAVLEPTYSSYYYFVADLETQKIYYATNLEEHEAYVAKYVNKTDESSQSIEESSSEAEE